MDLKFVELLQRFFPKGKFWDFQGNLKYLLNAISREFARAYKTSKTFYDEYNIIESTNLVTKHAEDYIIPKNIFTDREIQKIIVEYLNKNIKLKQVIEDFAIFINTPIEFGAITYPFIIGRSTTGNALGDPDYPNPRMVLYIKFLDVNDVSNIKKVKILVSYLKPPYLQVVYNTVNDVENIPFIVGRNTTGNPLGQILV